MRNATDAGRQLLEDAASMEDEMVGLAPQLAYDALRAGAPAAPQLERMAARCQSRLVTAYAQHGSAKAAADGAALLEAAEEMAAIGALGYGVEAASDAATAFLSQGRQDSARRAAARARQLHVPDQGAELPRIDGLDTAAVELTPREAQLIDLARKGSATPRSRTASCSRCGPSRRTCIGACRSSASTIAGTSEPRLGSPRGSSLEYVANYAGQAISSSARCCQTASCRAAQNTGRDPRRRGSDEQAV